MPNTPPLTFPTLGFHLFNMKLPQFPPPLWYGFIAILQWTQAQSDSITASPTRSFGGTDYLDNCWGSTQPCGQVGTVMDSCLGAPNFLACSCTNGLSSLDAA
jgi:hypothetical protein